jgi:hypothetical protein
LRGLGRQSFDRQHLLELHHPAARTHPHPSHVPMEPKPEPVKPAETVEQLIGRFSSSAQAAIAPETVQLLVVEPETVKPYETPVEHYIGLSSVLPETVQVLMGLEHPATRRRPGVEVVSSEQPPPQTPPRIQADDDTDEPPSTPTSQLRTLSGMFATAREAINSTIHTVVRPALP